MSLFGEFILRRLSRDPHCTDYVSMAYEEKYRDPETYAVSLTRTFPNLSRMVRGRQALDIGCSDGMEALALVAMGASKVIGIDIRIDPEKSAQLLASYPLRGCELAVMNAEKMTFADETFDVAMSCGSFEHFDEPYSVLKECKRVVKADGRICLTSGVWSHPWGAHMNFFTRVPWVQFIFSESTIMNVRRCYRGDGAKRFREVEGGLNKMGIRQFHDIVSELSLHIEYLRLVPVRRLSCLARIPGINEFFTSLVIAVLRKEAKT
ncbi:MAG: Ubiquinone biosynthesis O-methyltransferase [Syntrophorhabdus sp. PtaB.Bin047]|jgi:SAM-dependent methyltransferase|nr:MAG: Ubiquinone biosynthesis O-methyltransferase [Syntrophorhabdus sp. PtaB.Bin047]